MIPVCRAAPWPRLTGWRTRCAPVVRIWATEASELPSSTQTIWGNVRRVSSTTLATTAASLYTGMTTHASLKRLIESLGPATLPPVWPTVGHIVLASSELPGVVPSGHGQGDVVSHSTG